MIEREFIKQKTKEYYIKQHIQTTLKGAGISAITLKKIPLGEKIIIQTSRPSLIVGSKGSNIKALTRVLKTKFKLENPQVEISEVKNIFLDASIVAERIASSLERFGSARFKGVGHRVMQNVLDAGALGVELLISGKIPGARARSWRFYQGYLKKCGDVAVTGVRSAKTFALLKSGVIGIQVSIMPPNLQLPDHVEILSEPLQVVEKVEEEKPTKKKATRKKTTKKKTTKKAAPKKEEIKEVVEKEAEKEKPVQEPAKEEKTQEAQPVQETTQEAAQSEPATEKIEQEVTEESQSQEGSK